MTVMVTPRIDGIDISHWNEITDWDLAFAYPLVSLKATEGKRGRDATFPARWAKLREKNVKYRGAYHWLRADSTIAEQVANLVDYVGPELLDGEFIQLDWETTTGVPVPTSDMAIEFTDRVNWQYHGERTITYSSDWLPDSTLDLDSRREFEEWREQRPHAGLWFANYAIGTGSTAGWAESEKYGADIWQWSSSRLVPGFAGRIDVNHVFNWEALDLVTNQLVIPEPLIVPQEDPVIYVFIIPQDPEFEFEPGKQGVFTQDGHPVTGEYLDALRTAGAKISFVSQAPHPWWKEATLHRMGEQARRLYGDTPAS